MYNYHQHKQFSVFIIIDYKATGFDQTLVIFRPERGVKYKSTITLLFCGYIEVSVIR